jgi:hypothetical protein
VYRRSAHDLAGVMVVRGEAGESQGGYAYEHRQAPRTVDRVKVALLPRGTAMASDTRRRYGSRRMAKPLQEEGCAVGRAQARRLMQEAGVSVRCPRARGPVTTESRPG